MTTPLTLIFADGETCAITAEADQPIAVAAAEAGFPLLVDCMEGRCGTCTAQLLSGRVDLGDFDPMTLDEESQSRGTILPCVARALSPAAIEFPYDFSEVSPPLPPQAGRIARLEQVAAETLRLDVALEQPLDFLPGQYVRIGPAGGDFRRSYSMANRPGESLLTFYLRIVPDGQLSGWLTGGATVGDGLGVSRRPHGTFFLRQEPRHRLFVAGGTGLAPFLSMLELPDFAGTADTTILVGARTGAHLFGLDQLRDLVAARPGTTLKVAVEEDGPASCHAGRVTDLMTDVDPRTRVYLCGPPPMVDVGRKIAVAAGIDHDDVLCERFT